MEKIRLLEKEFTKKGIVYKQIERNEEKGYYIYKCQPEKNKYHTYFEIFKIKKQKPYELFAKDRDYDFVEIYPCDNSFGYWAYCCANENVLNMIIKEKFNTK